MNNSIVIDVETTISNNGNPFDSTNKCVMVGCKEINNLPSLYTFEPKLFNLPLLAIQEQIDNSSLLIGFNIKFDLHWLRKIGINISKIKVWDCQLAEFILNYQQTPYPSLDETAEKYGFSKKLDIVKTEYWDKGINTDEIPRDTLAKYLKQDLYLTQKIYENQKEEFVKNPKLFHLFLLHCQDLLVLTEMEWNGLYFNTEKAREKAEEINLKMENLTAELQNIVGNIPFNINSNDHLSCILYGGIIEQDIKLPVGTFKTGRKLGEIRYKILTKKYELPQIVVPLEGTKTKKEGYYFVNDKVLRSLKLNSKAKKIVNIITAHSELDKIRGTYLLGWSDLIDEMNWARNIIHGSLNQCVARTGRLASSKPNMQNADKETKAYCESRYEN